MISILNNKDKNSKPLKCISNIYYNDVFKFGHKI